MNTKTSVARSATFACGFALSLAAITTVQARPVPLSLVNGLDKIVEDSLLQQNAILPPLGTADAAAYKAAVAREAAVFKRIAITEVGTGKYLVDIMPDGQTAFSAFATSLRGVFPALNVTATNATYAGHGVVEGYVSLADALQLAKTPGVRSVVLQLKPIHSVGNTTSQGINQHRVNRINTIYSNATVNPNGLNYNGAGMQIGVMSDSYNSQPSSMGEGSYTTAQQDVATGDLPGIAVATPTAPNTQPVVVLQDYNPLGGATNEGRGMCQIVADIAPLARIGFATADVGELGFANNIRALGGLPGYTYPAAVQQGFKGDVVCDDVSYLDEPIFQDGIIAQGVIDVVNAGVTYCSSAANNSGHDGYAAPFRPVANGTGLTSSSNSALAGTNINLANVPAGLYAGGFHNFNPAAGQLDVAQTINTGSDAGAAVFQWNDPYDSTVPTPGALVYGPVNGNSTLTAPSTDYQVPLTGGQAYLIIEMATPQNAAENFDAIIDVIDPSGAIVLTQDTGADETVYYVPPATGTYTIRVRPFATMAPVGNVGVPTMGHYSLQVNLTTATVSRITQDFNLLFFTTGGAFISAVAANNFASNRPYELFVPTFSADGNTQVQMVISRANTTAPANAADQLKYVFFGNGVSGVGPAEYINYLTPVTFGHSAAAGGNSVAAYSMFRPNIPEDFTSPGPVTIYFDLNNNRLPTPQLRLKPDLAAADGANNTFFPLGPAQDVPFDADQNYANFYGTSAASPHAAAIAALVIQAHGGPGKLTPLQVKTLMQLNAFPHDLDPYASGGVATAGNGGTVSVNVVSDNSTANTNLGSNDKNAWTVSYTGSGFLKSLIFNTEATGATGGNPTGGNYKGGAGGGITEYADFLNGSNYTYTPGVVFNSNASTFLPGDSTGLTYGTDVTKTTTNAAPPPSTNAYYWTLNFGFPNSNFTAGKAFRFNIGRNQQQDAQTPQGMTIPSVLYGQTGQYSADLLGSGVFIPEYADVPQVQPGMTFSGVVTSGGTDYPFSSRIANRIGRGYSPLDGFGFVNAQAATTAALPVPGVVSRKVHGSAGTFDLPLPLTGTPAIECRSGGTNGAFTLVYTFDRVLASLGSATVTQGNGTAATPVFGAQPNEVVVNLTGVSNAQRLIVTLSGMQDSAGTILDPVPAPVNVLFGDVNASGRVDGNDVSAVQGKVRAAVNNSTFRFDINESGNIDGNDVSTVQGVVRTALP